MRSNLLKLFFAIIISVLAIGQVKANCVDITIPGGPFGNQGTATCETSCTNGAPCYLGENAFGFPELFEDDQCTQTCVPPPPAVCGNGTIEGAEECDDGNTTPGDGCDASCDLEPFCGNGILESGEECDDGGTADDDGCSATCLLETCDDSTVPGGPFGNQGEDVCIAACGIPLCFLDENAILHEDNACGIICTPPPPAVCGNNTIEGTEECDDGNTDPGDGCSATCTIEPVCGNSIVESGEECDDGGTIPDDGCSATCRIEVCADATIPGGLFGNQGVQVCINACQIPQCYVDEGGALFFDTGCNFDCGQPFCGNGVVEGTEECDDGNGTPNDGCTACTVDPFCGDGTVDTNEECDDGNNNDGDGCSAICEFERTCVTIDFNSLSTGAIVDTEFQNLAVPVTISANNDRASGPDNAIIFDSSNPSGNDEDLGTPNQAHGGPGQGSGGPATNLLPLGNILIIAEDIVDNDNNGLVDDPDDEASGGQIFFDFNEPVQIEKLDLIDIEDTNSNVKLIDASQTVLSTNNTQNLGSNSVQTMNINQADFLTSRLEVDLTSSGAVDNVKFCINPNPAPVNLAVSPILECVLDKSNGNYTAFFGYKNDNNVNVTIPIGNDNFFTGTGNQDAGQPSLFNPGRTNFYPNADFSVDFNGSNIVWTLEGPDGVRRTATASSNSQACTPICGNSVVESGETCDDGNTQPNDGCDGQCQVEISCTTPVMYAIHDEGSDDSVFIKFNFNTQQIVEINRRNDFDIEAIDTHPLTGAIYGLSGDSGDPASEKKLLIIDPVTGIPDLNSPNAIQLDIGSGQEYQAASFNPVTNQLWAAGDGGINLRTINVLPSEGTPGNSTVKAQLPSNGNVDAIAWDNQGSLLYLHVSDSSAGDSIISYDDTTQTFNTECTLNSQIDPFEGMEFDDQDRLVITTEDSSNTLSMDFFDLSTCQRQSSTTFNIPTNFNDSETMTFGCEQQFNNPPPNVSNSITPILECVARRRSSIYRAHFGYDNQNNQNITIPIGANNQFLYRGLIGLDGGQPTIFNPGRTSQFPNAEFAVDFNGNFDLTWQVVGPDQVSRSVTANSNSTSCPSTTAAPRVSETTICTEDDKFFVLDFKEITYFDNADVITSSEPKIRINNGGLGGLFDIAQWPFEAESTSAEKSQAKAKEFRVYGFNGPEGKTIAHATIPGLTYDVRKDPNFTNAFYIDLEGPAAVRVQVSDLQNNLLDPSASARGYHLDSTGVLSEDELDVPGIMLSYNKERVRIPKRIRNRLASQGRELLNTNGDPKLFTVLDSVSVLVPNSGSTRFSTFFDFEVSLPCENIDKRLFALRTVTDANGDALTINNCEYIDSDTSKNAVRFKDRFAKVSTINRGLDSNKACGDLEPELNQATRENSDLPSNKVQMLMTTGALNQLFNIIFGEIQ